MPTIDYKSKYNQLKTQFMESVDVAWRLGFEAGKQQAQLEDIQNQQAQQQEMAAQQQGLPPGQGGQPGEGGPESPEGGQESPEQAEDDTQSENPQGSELDQHIAKLESMVSKSDVTPQDLQKALSDIRKLRKSQQHDIEMKKAAQAISGIAEALHKPKFKISQQANHNMNDNAKRAVSMQHKIVEDVMKAWATEENKASNDILATLGVEGLTTKE